jgi:hypothetical protein
LVGEVVGYSKLKVLPSPPGGDDVPKSVSAVKDMHARELKQAWARQWATKKEGARLRLVDRSAPSALSLQRHSGLRRSQSSLLTQLQTGWSHLQANLFKARVAVDNLCECGAVESRHHFFLSCDLYTTQRLRLRKAVGPGAFDLSTLLSNPKVVRDTLRYIEETKRFPRYSAETASTGAKRGSRRWHAAMSEGRW